MGDHPTTIKVMNAQRRKRIQGIIDQIEDLKNDLESLMEEEQDCLDNMPESLQYSERGERMQSCIDTMDYANDNLGDAIDNLKEIFE